MGEVAIEILQSRVWVRSQQISKSLDARGVPGSVAVARVAIATNGKFGDVCLATGSLARAAMARRPLNPRAIEVGSGTAPTAAATAGGPPNLLFQTSRSRPSTSPSPSASPVEPFGWAVGSRSHVARSGNPRRRRRCRRRSRRWRRRRRGYPGRLPSGRRRRCFFILGVGDAGDAGGESSVGSGDLRYSRLAVGVVSLAT